MLVDSKQVTVPNGTSVNVFQGQPIEFIGAPSVARLLVVADEPGATMTWTINVAGVQHVPIASGSSVNVTPTGTFGGPKDDEDEVAVNVPMPAGSRNSLLVSAGGTVPITIRYRATILP